MTLNLRIFEIILLSTISIVAIFYTFEFGLILTAYPHGGQITGIPFTIVLLIYSYLIIFSKSKNIRQIFRIVNYCYISVMCGYLITIKIIKNVKKDAAWEYLNVFNPPEISNNERIFNYWAATGVVISLALIILRWIIIKKSKTDE